MGAVAPDRNRVRLSKGLMPAPSVVKTDPFRNPASGFCQSAYSFVGGRAIRRRPGSAARSTTEEHCNRDARRARNPQVASMRYLTN
jgi:hypothetical protein